MTESECQSMTWRDINICGPEAAHCSMDCSTVAPSCTSYCRLGRYDLQFLLPSKKSWMNFFISNVCGSKYYFFLSSDNKASIIVLSELQHRSALLSWYNYNCSAAEVAWSEGPGHPTQHVPRHGISESVNCLSSKPWILCRVDLPGPQTKLLC